MARWPDVPAVYGWLALDRRGNWLLNGERITNPLVTAFIGRNYECDAAGCWFFQNGPQRVYVDLDYTPLVCRVIDARGLVLEDHTGRPIEPHSAHLDDEGALLVDTSRGLALIHDADLFSLAERLVDGASGRPLTDDQLEARLRATPSHDGLALVDATGRTVSVDTVKRVETAARFGYVARPSALAGTTP